MIAPKVPADETQRLTALRSTSLLDSAPEERFDRITRIACRLFGVPIALVTLVDSHRQWFKSKQGLAADETPREISFCGHAILGAEPLIVENAQMDVRFFDNPLVTGSPGIRFYAGHPLVATDGSRVGTLCIISNESRRLLPDDRVLLQALATMVESELGALDLATTDAVTGLANLRGFLEIGDYMLRLAKRLKHPVHVLLLHVHVAPPASPRQESNNPPPEDPAFLAGIAAELLSSFAESDLVARIGPRQFAVMVSTSADQPGLDEHRLDTSINRLKTIPTLHEAFFVGHMTAFDPARHASLEELVSETEDILKQRRGRMT